MDSIHAHDIIEVTTKTEKFHAVVEFASHGGLAGMIVHRLGGAPHMLVSRAVFDSAAKGQWLLDDGEEAHIRSLKQR